MVPALMVAVAASAACGPAASNAHLPAGNAKLVARSASATAAEGSARVWIHTVSSWAAYGRLETTSSGVVTFDAPLRGRMRTRITLPGVAGVVRAKELITWRQIYIASPIYLPASNGRPWLVVDVVNARQHRLELFGGLDPFQALAVLRLYDARSVRDLGTTTIRGVPTVHLGLQLTPARLPAEVWIDADGLLRRAQFMPSRHGDHWEATIDFGEFGAPASIRLPARGAVTRRDLSDLETMAQAPAWHQ
jgi:hypothetical protein